MKSDYDSDLYYGDDAFAASWDDGWLDARAGIFNMDEEAPFEWRQGYLAGHRSGL